ncbi:OmpP1/FadL family transporter [Owenweeksia hongkongensis]|uniref:Outer membrane protein transport protein (OMPP1/FadL/TodX) n=1 Tax=Owenweeksia hongkongensis (strain DSM 17368 / CIP 108786 / JCM 12287 / NRRL B-23963 / UST20020801) TaxID=926562 RepID=G8R363_OWEHD|nr:hypothetical protein [Owenweeksia hongkongensis]AEV34088.1 hypothetical protein Oweho_3135 [Owenweeksia hongkongensis DSM 17368]
MKKAHLILMLAAGSFGLSAQSIDHLSLFSGTDLHGTPRYVSMGGAFTALGNDMSALHINPASGGVYRNDNFSFTLGFQNRGSETSFLGNNQEFNDFNFMLENIGLVKKFGSKGKYFFSLSYQKQADFSNFYSVSGVNRYNIDANGLETGVTLGEYWLDAANPNYRFNTNSLGFTSNELAQQGFLEEASSLGTVLLTDTNGYASIYDYWPDDATDINYRVEETGGRNEFALNLGGNFEDKFYYGIGIGFTSLNYRRIATLSESGYADSSYVVESIVNYRNEVDASGINLKLGFIYRPVQALRIGASLETPTWWYRVDEMQSVSVDAIAFDNTQFIGTEYLIDDIRYSIKSPMIARAGAAVVLGKHVIVSADYEYTNSQNLTLSERDGYDYSGFQADWETASQSTHGLKGGVELRFSSLYLRGGYQYRTSFFKEQFEYESDRSVYAFGIGYKSGSMGIDLGYSLAKYTTRPIVHNALAYGFDTTAQTPEDGALEGYDNDRATLTNTTQKGNFLIGLNFSF